MGVRRRPIAEESKPNAVDYYLTSAQLGAALTEGWLEENRDGTYREFDSARSILGKHLVVKKPLFFECTMCGKREPYSERQENLEAWNFGADLNLVEADGDGGLRGTHVSCARQTRPRTPST